MTVRDKKGNHFTSANTCDRPLDLDVILLRQDPPFDMSYITTTHMLERLPPQDPGGQRSAAVRNAPEKILVTRISRPDAADADHPRPSEIDATSATSMATSS